MLIFFANKESKLFSFENMKILHASHGGITSVKSIKDL